MGNSSLLNSHALQFIGQVCSCCKGSVLLSLSLSSMFKQDMDWWMTFQAKLSPRSLFHCDSYAPSTKSLGIPKARGSNHSTAIKKRSELWKTPKTSFQMPSLYTTPLMTFVLLSIYSNPFALPKSSQLRFTFVPISQSPVAVIVDGQVATYNTLAIRQWKVLIQKAETVAVVWDTTSRDAVQRCSQFKKRGTNKVMQRVLAINLYIYTCTYVWHFVGWD